MDDESIGSTPLSENSSAMREVFESMISAGFSEYQSCLIIGIMLSQGAKT